MFNLPTLVTLTAPTCGGKNFLLEKMVDAGFGRIVSTTDREPRVGEIEGVHYFFITTTQSEMKERHNLFAELVTYNGVRYGVTHEEMERKMAPGSPPPIVILEPAGLGIYRQYCGSKGWSLFSIFVDTPESVRLDRLVTRTTRDLMNAMWNIDFEHDAAQLERTIAGIVKANNKRLQAVFEKERQWRHKATWDAIVDGTNVEKAMAQIAMGIFNRNQRASVFS